MTLNCGPQLSDSELLEDDEEDEQLESDEELEELLQSELFREEDSPRAK